MIPTPEQANEMKSLATLIRGAGLVIVVIGDKRAALGKDMQDMIVSALTAAAEVGPDEGFGLAIVRRNAKAEEREHCAQIAEGITPYNATIDEQRICEKIAAAIREGRE